MKRQIFLFLFLLGFVALGASRQVKAQKQMVAAIGSAIKNKDAAALETYFGEVVEINVEENRQRYSKEKAASWAADFFVEFPPTDFQLIHQGASEKGVYYVIGEYKHSKGKFRAYLLLKQNGSNYAIDMMDFGSAD